MSNPQHNHWILIVDDEPMVCDALELLLKKGKHPVISATSGKQALEVLQENEAPTIVISDFMMPEMNGLELMRKIREKHPKSRRILLTGKADLATTLRALEDGIIHRYISKPWDSSRLLNTVNTLLKASIEEGRAGQRNEG